MGTTIGGSVLVKNVGSFFRLDLELNFPDICCFFVFRGPLFWAMVKLVVLLVTGDAFLKEKH